MPNICHNTLTVTGPEADVAAFVAKARGRAQVFARSPREQDDFLRRTKQEQERETAADQQEHALSFHALVPIPAGALACPYDDTGELPQFEGKSGYDWEKVLWGVKWGACDSSVAVLPGTAVYHYDTAWAPAQEFLERVSEMFPTLEFVNTWEVEGESFGSFLATDGEVRELWPEWIEDEWPLGSEPREVRARVWRVTSCDAIRGDQLRGVFAPCVLFEEEEEFPRSALDYVQALTAEGRRVVFYVDARQAHVGNVYDFHTRGQHLRVRDSNELAWGERAIGMRVPRPT
jgi:hypothetical protein